MRNLDKISIKSAPRHRGNVLKLLTAGALALMSGFGILVSGGCEKGESYSELLREEEKAVNWYLAQHRVEMDIPADGHFETGEDAPFYRMDRDGTVYMQVIDPGDAECKAESGEKIYFRFKRENIILMYNGTPAPPYGNTDDLSSSVGPTYFFYGNKTYPTTVQYGTGIQVPLEYLGLDSEVNLVLKSYSGFTEDQTLCQPFLLNVKYFKATY